jgi:hypothetical protein
MRRRLWLLLHLLATPSWLEATKKTEQNDDKLKEQVLTAQAKAAFDMVVAYMQRGDILTKQAQIELFMLQGPRVTCPLVHESL